MNPLIDVVVKDGTLKFIWDRLLPYSATAFHRDTNAVSAFKKIMLRLPLGIIIFREDVDGYYHLVSGEDVIYGAMLAMDNIYPTKDRPTQRRMEQYTTQYILIRSGTPLNLINDIVDLYCPQSATKFNTSVAPPMTDLD